MAREARKKQVCGMFGIAHKHRQRTKGSGLVFILRD